MVDMRRVGEDFRPAPQFKTLYYTYFILLFIFLILWWLIPVLVFIPIVYSYTVLVPVIVIIIAVIYWIPKYYRTMTYKLAGNEIVWRRGVWFRNTGIVPYNRITNVDIAQGPISRKLGIAALKIQTAGYSAPSGRSSEIRIEGIGNFEELRETIMGFVRGRRPVAVETYDEADQEPGVLAELVKIRKLLEKRRR
jgi:membrane protein YdbS with pleckstrin-like domain